MSMLQAATYEFFSLLRFSNGRRLFVLQTLLNIAASLASPLLIARIEGAIASERELRKLEAGWRRVRGKKSKARGNAVQLDAQLDRLIGSIYRTVQEALVPLAPGSAAEIMVKAFLGNYFPEGAAAITNAEFEDALAIIEEMNEDFALLSEADLGTLNIANHVPELARIAPLFAHELKSSDTGKVRFADVSAARIEGHENLCGIVATICSEYWGKEEEKVAARAALLAPIREANDRVAARRKIKNTPDVDVDPETGEELDGVQNVVKGGGGGGQDGEEEETT